MADLADFRPDMQPLAGQVALVTGGGRGLGRAMARTLAQAGVAVGVVARTVSEVEETTALCETTIEQLTFLIDDQMLLEVGLYLTSSRSNMFSTGITLVKYCRQDAHFRQ